MTRLRLSVLGPFRLEADAEIALPSRKAQALLAYLALSAGRPHRRDKLASLLWADRGDAAARHNLRQALSSIAKAIRPASTDAAAMITNADRIAVDPAAFDVDAARLEGLVADASPEALLEAVKLCHGDLLDGLNLQAEPFEEWLTAQRSRFRELAVQAHRLLLEHQISCDSHEAAVLTALRFLALDPTDEDAHRKLMRLYLAQGRKDAA
jgi:DNA-binding SARP family transcriptional activator